MQSTVDSRFETPRLTVFTHEHVVIAITKQQCTLPDVDLLQQVFRAQRARRPDEKLGYLCVLEEAAGLLLPADVRGALAQLMRDHQHALRAVALVFEAKGFGAAIVRSIMAAISVATRSDTPTTAVGSVREGTEWLFGKGVPRGSRDLAELVREMRTSPPAAHSGMRR